MQRTRRSAVALLAVALLVAGAAAAVAADDPYRPQQWGLERIGAPAAWARTQGDGVVIAILDTGIDLEHPDLADRLLRDDDGRVVGRDVVDGDDDPQDENGHGTMVAGIAVAATDNGIGIAGTAPEARIMPVRVLDADGGGRYAHLDAGIRWAVDAGAHVINLSLERAEEPGTIGRTLDQLTAPVSAVQYAWDNGVVVVAAAGNSSSDVTDYPDDSPVLLVGATDREDRRAGFSDAGRRDAVVAPGIDIVSTWCDPQPGGGCGSDHRYGVASGTSFAAPFVAGAVALLREQGRDHRGAVERLRATARDVGAAGPDTATGHGLVDVDAATRPDGDSTTSSPQPEPSPPRQPPATEQAAAPPADPSPPEAPEASPATPSPSPATPVPEVAAPTAPTDPSPIAAPAPPATAERAAWSGLATVVLLVTIGAVAVNVYRHGLTGRSGARPWGLPERPVKSRGARADEGGGDSGDAPRRVRGA